MSRSRIFLIALALSLSLLGGIVQAQDQVTITLMGHSSSPAEDEALQAQIAAFEEANPDIDVDVQLVPEFDTVLQTAFASGDYPDVFYVSQEKIDEYANAGVLAVPGDTDITDREDIYPSLVTTYTYNGTFYCPAKDFSNLALEYNTDVFDQAGVEYPTADWTWDDLRAAAEQIAANTDVVPLAVNPDIDRWFAFYTQAGGKLYDEEGNFVFGQDANYDAAVTALDFYAGLYQDGLAQTSQDLGAGWTGEAFGQGKAAMTVEGNWIIQYLLDTFPDLNWGVAEMPAGPDGTEGTLTFSECYGVGADSEHPAEAWKLVDFLTGPEGAARLAEGGFGPMPTRLSAGDAWLQNRGEQYEPFVAGAEYAVAPFMPPGFQEFRDTLGNGIQQLFEGNATAEEVVDDSVEVAQELQEEG